jgi:Xaa-Pro aminopeptidase
MSATDNETPFERRLASLRRLMSDQELEAVRLTLQKNVSWLLGGRSHVNTASEPACCQFLVTANDCFLLVNNIEAERVLAEEADDGAPTAVVPLVWPWHAPERREALAQEALLGWRRVAGDADLEAALLVLRTTVPLEERNDWRELGRDTAEALAQAARELRRGQSEAAIAGLVARCCWERGLEPIVNLIAVDDRIFTRRHPLPTSRALDSYAMLVVCARRHGRIASATRLVRFGAVPQDVRDRHRAVAEIDARVIDATRAGVTLDGLYRQLESFYRDAGYPDEIRHHHQGGLTGYTTREKLALPGDGFVIQPYQLYAWNPSVAGAKSEDTILTTDGAPELLTLPEGDDFPIVEVKVGDTIWRRPDILQR